MLCYAMLCDEATASVDFETDELIQKTLRTSLDGISVLTIAHRLDTVMHCDTVVVVDEGRVAESGAPEELRARPGGRFAELWDARG